MNQALSRCLPAALAPVAVMAMLAACSNPQDVEGETGGNEPTSEQQRLVVGLPGDPDILDPSLTHTLNAIYVLTNICEPLYIPDKDLNIQPLLAADLPEISGDGLTMRIPLREGIEFNDGEPFNADAVATSLQRHIEIEASARASDLGPIEDITVVDDLTVELTLAEPAGSLTAALAEVGGMIMSPAQLDKLGDDFSSEPVCVGPFSFRERTAAGIVLERSEHYYDADQVFLDELVFATADDDNVRVANLLSGELDLVVRLPNADIDSVESDDSTGVVSALELGYAGIALNIANANGVGEAPQEIDSPLADPLVREAFELSLDRQAISEVVFNGRVVPGCGPISPASPLYPDIACPERDVDGAQALLDQAGVETPVSLEMILPSGAQNVRLAEVIQSMAGEAGFEIEVRPNDLTTAIEAVNQGDYEAFLVAWGGTLDPDATLFGIHHSSGVYNATGASGDDIDALLEQGRAEADPDTRKAVYADAVQAIMERRNVIHLYHGEHFLGVSDNVEGFTFTSDGTLRFKGVSLADS